MNKPSVMKRMQGCSGQKILNDTVQKMFCEQAKPKREGCKTVSTNKPVRNMKYWKVFFMNKPSLMKSCKISSETPYYEKHEELGKKGLCMDMPSLKEKYHTLHNIVTANSQEDKRNLCEQAKHNLSCKVLKNFKYLGLNKLEHSMKCCKVNAENFRINNWFILLGSEV